MVYIANAKWDRKETRDCDCDCDCDPVSPKKGKEPANATATQLLNESDKQCQHQHQPKHCHELINYLLQNCRPLLCSYIYIFLKTKILK